MRGIYELDTLRDQNGDAVVVTGAQVTVRRESDGALATLYDDLVGTTGPGNPFNVQGSTIRFYADQSQRYRIDIVAMALSRTLRHQSVSILAQSIADDANLYADTAIATHEAKTGGVHGVPVGEALEWQSQAQTRADQAFSAAVSHLDAHNIDASAHGMTDAGGAVLRAATAAEQRMAMAIVAANVPFTPTATITATDVQGAIEQATALGADGLKHFVESRSIDIPNALVPVHAFTPNGTETDIDVALSPKGAGALTADVADGTTAGGNKRGAHAVDWQSSRSIEHSVASGAKSVISGGSRNRAGGESATVGGGEDNNANGNYTVISGGLSNTGVFNFATVGGGAGNYAAFECSTIPGGYSASTRGYGQYAYASGSFQWGGDAQSTRMMLRRETGDATPAILTSDGLAPNAGVINYHRLIRTNGTPGAAKIQAEIVAMDTTNHLVKAWKIEGVAKMPGTFDTAAVVGNPIKTVLAADIGTEPWNCNLIANLSRGSAEIEVTGMAGQTIRWVCTFDTTDVG